MYYLNFEGKEINFSFKKKYFKNIKVVVSYVFSFTALFFFSNT